jgi:hypothetical protein
MPVRTLISHGVMSVDKYAIGVHFVSYCVEKGWLVKEVKGKRTNYLLTINGMRALKKFGMRFDI